MKKDIHPNYQETVFRCACGAEIKTRSTKPEYKLEICSNCHPFFTGKQKLVDSAGRVERFMRKYGDTAVATGKKPVKAPKKAVTPKAPIRKVKPPAAKTKPAADKKIGRCFWLLDAFQDGAPSGEYHSKSYDRPGTMVLHARKCSIG